MRAAKVSWGNHPVSHPYPERGGLSSKIPGTEPLQPNSTAIRRRDLNTAERCNLFSPPPTIETNCLRGLGWRVFASLE